jgi:hypothetical protein
MRDMDPGPLRMAAVLAAVLLSSCTANGTRPVADAELEILVVRGPTSPIETEGEANVVTVANASVSVRPVPSGRAIQIDTDADGRARLTLPSGDYELVVTRCPEGTLFTKRQDVRIATGAQASATLVCDTGIR